MENKTFSHLVLFYHDVVNANKALDWRIYSVFAGVNEYTTGMVAGSGAVIRTYAHYQSLGLRLSVKYHYSTSVAILILRFYVWRQLIFVFVGVTSDDYEGAGVMRPCDVFGVQVRWL